MTRSQIIALVLVAIALGAIVALKATRGPAPTDVSATQPQAPAVGLPRLVDLGSTTCLPCKQMAPILEELKAELQGKIVVEVIDIAKDPKAADTYAINVIPTQIIFDARGREVFRHEGFLAKADILAQLEKQGIQTH
mgnify:CR=1 FL=1